MLNRKVRRSDDEERVVAEKLGRYDFVEKLKLSGRDEEEIDDRADDLCEIGSRRDTRVADKQFAIRHNNRSCHEVSLYVVELIDGVFVPIGKQL